MTEQLDPFERSLERAFLAFAEHAPTRVDAVEFTARVTAPPQRRARLDWLRPRARLSTAPAMAWVLLLAGLLLALVVGAMIAGTWRRDLAIVLAPSPSPTATAPVEGATVLATTKAHPLPAQATCPADSHPDLPGPPDQERPSGAAVDVSHGTMAFDRHAGLIVLLAPGPGDASGPATTWTFDVCTNTWRRMHPAEVPPLGSLLSPARLVYDADSDRTLAFTGSQIWSYDLAGDRWTQTGSAPWPADPAAGPTYGTAFYHDPSGLVVVDDGATMWAYDVDSGTVTTVPQRPDPAQPDGSGLPSGKIALGYDRARDLVVAVVDPYPDPGLRTNASSYGGETWVFEPASGSWRKEASPAAVDLIVCGKVDEFPTSSQCYPTNGRAVFDEALGLPVFMSGISYRSGRVDAYDTGQGAWRTLVGDSDGSAAVPGTCVSMPPVYDPLNGRIVCLSDGVVALSTVSGYLRWLVGPSATSTPAP